MKSKSVQYPASLGQEGLWSLEKTADVGAAYHISNQVEIVSRYDIKILKNFFEIFVTHHQICSSTFKMDNGKLLLFKNNHPVDFYYVIESEKFEELELHQKIKECYDEPFDLENGPLLKVFLFTISPTNAILLIVSHHLISDGLSSLIFTEELKKGYTSLIKTGEYFPTPLEHSYYDFAQWQHALIKSEEGIKQKKFWHNKLAGELSILSLPTTFSRVSNNFYRGDIHFFTISEEQLFSIKQLEKSSSTSLFSFFMAIFQILLNKYCNQTDIIIGHPSSGRFRNTAGRSRADYANNFGYFVNVLLYRSSFSIEISFQDLLRTTNEYLKEDLNNQDYPFGEIYKDLKFVQRQLSQPQVLLNFYGKQRKGHRDISIPNS